MIQCPHCTFENNDLLQNCEVCSGVLRSDVLENEPELITDSIACSTCSYMNPANYLQCSICSSEITVVKDKDNSSISFNTTDNMSNVCDGTEEFTDLQCTEGIIELLGPVLECQKQRMVGHLHMSYKLCSPTPHITQKGAHGQQWACGYRNLQMLLLSLMKCPTYSKLLFSGDGRVPDIYNIQLWIERAWAAGFDAQGAADFPNGILGTSLWIGATEITMLLRFFGIRAHVVDIMDDDYCVKRSREGLIYMCDICSERINGVRYQCTVRSGYDICTTCISIPQPYAMTRIDPFAPTSDILADKRISKPAVHGSDFADSFNDAGTSSTSSTDRASTNKSGKVISQSGRALALWLERYFRDFENAAQQCRDHEHEAKDVTDSTEQAKSSMHSSSKRARLSSKTVLMQLTSSADAIDAVPADRPPMDKKESGTTVDHSEMIVPLDSNIERKQSIDMNFVPTLQNTDLAAMQPSSGVSSEQRVLSLLPTEHGGLTSEQVSSRIHPLYLQHDGHSRSVIGYMQDSNATHASEVHNESMSLLLFDPAAIGSKMKTSLELAFASGTACNWGRTLKRGLHTFKHGAYQIVYCDGVMTSEEREVSKLLVARKPTDVLHASIVR